MRNPEKKRVLVICPGNDDSLLFPRLAAWLGNRSRKYPTTEFTCIRFGWRGQSRIEPDQLELAYNERYKALLAKLEQLRETYSTIAVLGISASAHLALLLLLNEQIQEAIMFAGLGSGGLPEGNKSRLVGVGLRQVSDKINFMTDLEREAIQPIVVIPRRDNLVPILRMSTQLRNQQVVSIEGGHHLLITKFGLVHYVLSGEANSR